MFAFRVDPQTAAASLQNPASDSLRNLYWVTSPLIVKIPQFLAWYVRVDCGQIGANFAELDCRRVEDNAIHSADKILRGFWFKQRPFKHCGTTVNINEYLINRPRDLPLKNDVRKVRAKRGCPVLLGCAGK